ncbi:head-tail connector protein [Weizmannia coagulans]|jgi:uncharacterized phage protein (predicted DNA packaging)|uniref:DNA packaging protein n=2 Tax=Heyndrickxia TaxID=2837504 RepID=A0AAN0T4T2_HEYCO|nr:MULTISPECIES: head-tail connector protein [Heyndrickxia]NWN93798.1 phage gp6-like head-tail connector protein [Bacillus sp. (in: firmicutes)]AJO22882.1 DNA packaging protein [Heyndrickxia coagulans]AKN55607.1 Phage protein [Heyndrickxia coagulans]ATW83121.1 phage gp6-like head-tail connector protein [Heyndrickxia coagulans]KGB28327.1 DNA packaging protein [Heyndrickxia coagulans]
MIIELNEAKDWLRVDTENDDARITSLMAAAEQYLTNATGKTFDSTNELARLFCLTLLTDWYDNTGLSGTEPSQQMRPIIQSMLLQLTYCEDEVT